MTEIRRILTSHAILGMLVVITVISLFFTIRQEHEKWEASAVILNTDVSVLRSEYIRQIKVLEEQELRASDIQEAIEKVQRKNEAVLDISMDEAYVDYVREVYVTPKTEAYLSYSDYLKKIHENAENYQKISLFSKENSYTLRNIRKTDADYQRVAQVQPKLRVFDAISELLTNPVPDVLILLFCLSFTFFISAERRNRLWELLHTTTAGRGKLFRLRLLTLLPTILLAIFIVYLPSFLYLSFLYGLPDLTVCVQSVELFRELSYPITLGAFLFQLLAFRWLGFFSVSILFWFIIEGFSSAVFSAVLSGFVVLLGYLLYRLIPLQSIWAFVRVVNVFSCLDTVNIYGRYLNLNLFGYPVSAAVCNMIFMTIVILGSGIGLAAVYRWKRPQERSRVLVYLEDLIYKRRDQIFILLPRISLGFYKAFILQHGLFVLLLLFLGILRLLPETRAYVAGAEYLALAREEEIAAPFDDPKTNAFFTEERTAIQDAYRTYDDLHERYENGELDELSWFMEENKIQGFQVRQESLDILAKEKNRLQKLYNDRGIRGWILNPQSYAQLLGEGKDLAVRYLLYAAAAVIVLCLCISGMFSFEKKSGVQPLLHLTKKDGLPFFFRKELLALLYAVFTVLVIYLPDIHRIHELYPIHALDAPIQSLSWMQDIRAPITIRGYLIFLTIYRILMLFLIAQPVLLISSKTKEPRISAILAVGTLGLTSLLYLISIPALQAVNMAYLVEGRIILHQILSGCIPCMLLLNGWAVVFILCSMVII